MANKHTIVLIQASQNRSTRTFMDFDSISQAMDGPEFPSSFLRPRCCTLGWGCTYWLTWMQLGLCGLYERKLKEINPTISNISYDITDLYNFIDGFADLSALVYDNTIHAFLPYDRLWIKQRIFQHLKRLASR